MCSLLHVCGRAWNDFDARKSDVENDHNFYVFPSMALSHNDLIITCEMWMFSLAKLRLWEWNKEKHSQIMCARISIVYLHNQWVHDTFYIINSKVLETLNGIANGIILWTFILV